MNQIRGFAPLIVVLLIGVAGYFFTYPQWTNLGENKTVLEQVQQENETLKKQEQDINTFLSNYRAQKNQTDLAGKILPLRKTEVESVLANLDAFASSSGVSLASAAFNDQSLSQGTNSKLADNQITYIEISLSAGGTYQSFRSFLAQMENSLRVMDIISINLIKSDDSNPQMDYKLIARAYYQK